MSLAQPKQMFSHLHSWQQRVGNPMRNKVMILFYLFDGQNLRGRILGQNLVCRHSHVTVGSPKQLIGVEMDLMHVTSHPPARDLPEAAIGQS
ncbi:hypothetical protein AVEN_51119-1 [Araneus ventricosus]|uniref:Uncharacterized protein n=1 Tax=Araneus ventricosus TaxID=182803 RepID=A0A4Y2KL55_ARAVE|nr:hypothetical protein AVEN_51119-1 [Araneus ventricosus]